MTEASAPGKVILCGEHAVVYGKPAIALPLPDVRATAHVRAAPAGSGITLLLPDVNEQWSIAAATDHPLATLIQQTLETLLIIQPPDLTITLRSAIPIASGMGSGAALGAALVKALAAHLGAPLSPAKVARLVYESERYFHGTPSGIDNTVVSYQQAIWFVRNLGDGPHAPDDPNRSAALTPSAGVHRVSSVIEPVSIARPFTLIIGDTGVRAPTHVTVGGVRECRQREPGRYSALFDAVEQAVLRVRHGLATGDLHAVGAALTANQALLVEIGVSSPELERLVAAALAAGATGAKLSGGGGGGIMLALVPDQNTAGQPAAVAQALLDAGAVRVLHTCVG